MTAHSEPQPELAMEESDLAPAAPSSGVVRKIAVGAAGSTVTVAGVVMLITPGPGILVTLAGLGILSSEFSAARRLLDRMKNAVRSN